MPDLAPGQPTGGPATPTRPAEPPLPLPSAPAAVAADDLTTLSAHELEERIAARERDMKFRLRAIRHEVGELGSDLTLGDRPLMDWIREHKEVAVGSVAAVGVLVGIVLGVRARRQALGEMDDTGDIVRFRMEAVMEDAAQRVARGENVEDATRRAVAAAPVVYADNRVTASAKSSLMQAVDVGLKSLVGVVAKSVGDQITASFSGRPPR
jgi:ElaB/YqjD/DUF883 family membrane-anchored ribosome-binding protein